MPIIPIGHRKSRNPRENGKSINQYTAEGKKEIFKPPDGDTEIMTYIMCNPVKGRTIEYNDNRISLYVRQHEKCAITEQKLEIGEMQCHHIIPKSKGGNDGYKNLTFVTKTVHRLIHATDKDTMSKYLDLINPDNKQIEKLNKLRVSAGLNKIQ